MTFGRFEQERQESADREERRRSETRQKSREGARVLKAELKDFITDFSQKAQFPPDTELIEYRTTYSVGTVRKGFLRKHHEAIVEDSQISRRAKGWDLGVLGRPLYDGSGIPYVSPSPHWYIDTNGDIWFDVTLDPIGRVLDSIAADRSSVRFTGDVPPREYWEDYGGGTRSRPKRYLWLDIDRVAEEYDDPYGGARPIYIRLLSRSLFSFIDQVDKNYEWGSSPDGIRWSPTGITFEYRYQYDATGYTPLLEKIYNSAVEKGIIA